MIRQEWSLISFVVCIVAGLVILAPLIPYVIVNIAPATIPLPAFGTAELAILLLISGIISAVFTTIFYKINLAYASELLRKAEN